jgi:hypothetical protein
MKRAMFFGCVGAVFAIGAAKADPVSLSTYVDANGFQDEKIIHALGVVLKVMRAELGIKMR